MREIGNGWQPLPRILSIEDAHTVERRIFRVGSGKGLQQADAAAGGALLLTVLVKFCAVHKVSPFSANSLQLCMGLNGNPQQALQCNVVGQERHEALFQLVIHVCAHACCIAPC